MFNSNIKKQKQIESLSSNAIPSVDRPDIAKVSYKPNLTIKEMRDIFFKCLTLSGISFEENQKLFINSYCIDKKKDRLISVRAGYYNSTCTLSKYTINNKPIHIILLQKELNTINNRQINKILHLKKIYNLVVFDEDDWESLGLKVCSKEWLGALNKITIKSLMKKLYLKIADLNGEVRSELNFNEVMSNIDNNININSYALENLLQENLTLRRQLKKIEFINKFNITNINNNLIDPIVTYDKQSLICIENILTTIVKHLYKINYKTLFNNKTTYNKDILSTYLVNLLNRNKSIFRYNILPNGAIRCQNKNTFQNIYILLSISNSPINSIGIKKVVEPNSDSLIYHLFVKINKYKHKVSTIGLEVFNRADIKNNKIIKKNRLEILKLQNFNFKKLKFLTITP